MATIKELQEQIAAAQAAAQPQQMGGGVNAFSYTNPDAVARLQSLQGQLDAYSQSAEGIKELKASGGRNLDGSYIRPDWESMVDPTTGLLKEQYILGSDYKPIEMNETGLNQFRGEATRGAGTDSAWAKAQLAQNANTTQTGINTAAATQNAAAQGLRDAMAAQGGLRGGASERVAQTSLKDLMRGRQDIRNTGNVANLQTRTTDEGNRITQLRDLVGMDASKANFDATNQQTKLKIDQSNISNAMAEQSNKRNAELDAWKKNQEVWASNKQADAQAQAGGGGK